MESITIHDLPQDLLTLLFDRLRQENLLALFAFRCSGRIELLALDAPRLDSPWLQLVYKWRRDSYILDFLIREIARLLPYKLTQWALNRPSLRKDFLVALSNTAQDQALHCLPESFPIVMYLIQEHHLSV